MGTKWQNLVSIKYKQILLRLKETNLNTNVHKNMQKYNYAHTCTHIHAHTRTYNYAHTCTHMYAHTHQHTDVPNHYIQTYINKIGTRPVPTLHTHTHTHNTHTQHTHTTHTQTHTHTHTHTTYRHIHGVVLSQHVVHISPVFQLPASSPAAQWHQLILRIRVLLR